MSLRHGYVHQVGGRIRLIMVANDVEEMEGGMFGGGRFFVTLVIGVKYK
jgi:hypothetical protein